MRNHQKKYNELETVKNPLKEMVGLFQIEEVPFKVIYFPKFQDDEDREFKHSMFAQIVEELEIQNDVLDLTSAFPIETIGKTSLDPTHPNEVGDEIAAQQIFEFLEPTIATHSVIIKNKGL